MKIQFKIYNYREILLDGFVYDDIEKSVVQGHLRKRKIGFL